MLVPERRMNKNGVWSTKHVKPTNATKPASVPPPSITAINKTRVARAVTITAAYSRQTRKSEHIEYPFSFKPDHRLVTYLKTVVKKYPSTKSDDFYWCESDLTTYDVLSVATPDTAVPLLNAGIKSAEEAVDALTAAGCSDLIIDSSLLVQSAVEMGLDARNFIEHTNTSSNMIRDESVPLVDRLLRVAEKPLKWTIPGSDPKTTFQELIDQDVISREHVSLIGTERLHGALDSDGLLIADLAKMHEGTSAYAPEDLDEFISEHNLVGKKSVEYTKRYVYALASRHGGDYIRNGPRDMMSMLVRTDFSRLATRFWEYSAERERDFIAFGEETREEVARMTNDMANFEDNDYKRLFESGVSPQDIGRGKQSGMDVTQIIAVHNGTHPGVSSGWL